MTANELGENLPAFLQTVTSDECVAWSAQRTGQDSSVVREIIGQYAGEVAVAISLLEGTPLVGRRLLDVGTGIGLTSFFLHSRGTDVTALEPGGIGFGRNSALFLSIREFLGNPGVELLPIGAEQLQPHEHGAFDVIFSVNVLEHVADLDGVIRAMANVLSETGVMIHTCPNYTVPYEPHYGIPLLPLFPGATPWARRRKQDDVWRSLNFVTVRRLRRLLENAGVEPHFTRGTMAQAFQRLLSDPGFAARHRSYLALTARLIRRIGVDAALRRLPPELATPLIVRASKSPAHGHCGKLGCRPEMAAAF